jgi:hypothetical protein
MTAFAAPIAEQIWDMKYRLKGQDGSPLDGTVQDTWRRVARALATRRHVCCTVSSIGVPSCPFRRYFMSHICSAMGAAKAVMATLRLG